MGFVRGFGTCRSPPVCFSEREIPTFPVSPFCTVLHFRKGERSDVGRVNTVGYPVQGPGMCTFLTFLNIPDTTMRVFLLGNIKDRMSGRWDHCAPRCLTNGIYRGLPCRHPILHPVLPGESRALCAEFPLVSHTLEEGRALFSPHPG